MPSIITIEGARSSLMSLERSAPVEWLRRQDPLVLAGVVLGTAIVAGYVISKIFVGASHAAAAAVQ